MKRIFLSIGLSILYAIFFRVEGIGMVVLVVGTGIVSLFLEKMLRTEEMLKRDFFQLTEYMQGMGMSFLLSGTAYGALKENVTLFSRSKMRNVLMEACKHVEENLDGTGIQGAFEMIEREYPCKKLRRLHHYILTASQVGGDYGKGVRLLLTEQEQWKRRQMLSNESIRIERRRVVISIVLTILLCGYVAGLTVGDIEVSGSPVYQMGMILFWFCCMGIYFLSVKIGKMDWYESEEVYSALEIQEKLLRHKKEEKKHKIGYAARQKILQKELIKAFPEWMLEVALRMEGKNVENALEESYENAPAIIRFYLGRMLAELKQHPAEGDAYFRFADDLQVPEITNSMKLLYAMSKGIVAGGEEQMKELIERNYRMDEQAADFRLEKRRSILYGCSLLPSLFGAGCMILNMSLLLVGFMANLKV